MAYPSTVAVCLRLPRLLRSRRRPRPLTCHGLAEPVDPAGCHTSPCRCNLSMCMHPCGPQGLRLEVDGGRRRVVQRRRGAAAHGGHRGHRLPQQHTLRVAQHARPQQVGPDRHPALRVATGCCVGPYRRWFAGARSVWMLAGDGSGVGGGFATATCMRAEGRGADLWGGRGTTAYLLFGR